MTVPTTPKLSPSLEAMRVVAGWELRCVDHARDEDGHESCDDCRIDAIFHARQLDAFAAQRLYEVGDELRQKHGCTDGGCQIGTRSKGGMATNGGCRCLDEIARMERMDARRKLRQIFRDLQDAIRSRGGAK